MANGNHRFGLPSGRSALLERSHITPVMSHGIVTAVFERTECLSFSSTSTSYRTDGKGRVAVHKIMDGYLA